MKTINKSGKNDFSRQWAEQLVAYNAETGVVTWRVQTGSNAKVGQPVGTKMKAGHLTTTIMGKRCLVHRLAWLLYYGEWPESCIDHINRDPADNRIDNLRLANHSTNGHNRDKPSNNNSGEKNVYFEAFTQRWRGLVMIDGRKIYVGRFKTIEEAAEAVRAKKLELIPGYELEIR